MLVRTRPFTARLRPFERTFDRTLDDFVDSFFSPGRFAPPAAAVASKWENGALKLTVDLPGVPQDAVDVSVTGRSLTISVKTDTLSWQRTLSVGAGLDPEQVSAQYANGRLTIVVNPVPAAQPRQIEITTAPAIEAGEPGQPDEGGQDTSAIA